MKRASLFEMALAEQEARNAAAIAAIRSRKSDIAELQRLTNALAGRGLNVRSEVCTVPCGVNASCVLQVCMECTRGQQRSALAWLIAADIGITRLNSPDGDELVYALSLRGQQVMLKVALTEPRPKLLQRIFATAA